MKIGQRLIIGFAIIILINAIAGVLIIKNMDTVQQYYQSKKSMDNLTADLKDSMLTENEFRSTYNTSLVVDFQLEYRNITRDIYDMQTSGMSYGNETNFTDMQSSVHSYHDLILNNNEYLYSIENLWRTEQSLMTSPGGITDSSEAIKERVLDLGAENNNTAKGMGYLYDMMQGEQNFLSTHDPVYLNYIHDRENLTLAWSGNDAELTQDVWRYNNNIDMLATLYSQSIHTNGDIDMTVGSLGDEISSTGTTVNGEFEDALRQTTLTVISLITISILSSVIILIFITRSVSKPIETLAQASEKIARGDWKTKVSTKGNDEVSSLARSFQKMVTSIRERIEFNDALIRNMVDAQIMVHPEGEIFYFNEAASKLTGYSFDEVVGKPYGMLLAELPIPSDVRSDQSCNCTLIKKDQAHVRSFCRLSVVKNGEGNRIGTMIMIRESKTQ